jgi:hypothetical protein
MHDRCGITAMRPRYVCAKQCGVRTKRATACGLYLWIGNDRVGRAPSRHRGSSPLANIYSRVVVAISGGFVLPGVAAIQHGTTTTAAGLSGSSIVEPWLPTTAGLVWSFSC